MLQACHLPSIITALRVRFAQITPSISGSPVATSTTSSFRRTESPCSKEKILNDLKALALTHSQVREHMCRVQVYPRRFHSFHSQFAFYSSAVGAKLLQLHTCFQSTNPEGSALLNFLRAVSLRVRCVTRVWRALSLAPILQVRLGISRRRLSILRCFGFSCLVRGNGIRLDF